MNIGLIFDIQTSNYLFRMTDNLRSWVHTHFDYVTGFGTGSISGLITIPTLSSTLYTIVMAFLTGAAGATAAHLIRQLFDRLKQPKHGK